MLSRWIQKATGKISPAIPRLPRIETKRLADIQRERSELSLTKDAQKTWLYRHENASWIPCHSAPDLHGETLRSVQFGRYHQLLLTEDEHLFAWGSNEFGQCGPVNVKFLSVNLTGLADDDELQFPTMVSSIENQKFKSISTGCFHNFALTADGHLYGFGAGMLGCDSEIYDPLPRKLILFDEHSSWKALDISSHSNYSLCIAQSKDTGEKHVFGWGYLPTMTKSLKPLRYQLSPANPVAITAGKHHFCVVSSDENTLTVGSFYEPSYANVATEALTTPCPFYKETPAITNHHDWTPQRISSIDSSLVRIRKVECGSDFNLLLDEEGQLFMDQFGTKNELQPLQSTVKFLDIAVDGPDNFCLDTNGRLWSVIPEHNVVRLRNDIPQEHPNATNIHCKYGKMILFTRESKPPISIGEYI